MRLVPQSLDDLVTLLDLERIEENLFRAASPTRRCSESSGVR
jgi:acyl-CoA thioesterase